MKNINRQHSDYWLSLSVFSLIVFGLIMVYSVSKYYSLQITNEETDKYYLIRQLRWLGLGVISWIIFQAIDYKFWQKNIKVMFYLTFIFLILPLLPLIGGGGAGERWVSFGFGTFQPSELAKLTLIIYVSAWFANAREDLSKIKKYFIPFLFLMIVVSGLMLIQKDLGSLAVILAISASIFVVSGAPVSQLLAGTGATIFLFWLSIKIEPYRMKRFLTFLNPENETLSSGYHIRNALIAAGSGGWMGLGFGQSIQKYLYLPEAHTDSIFAIICEELGFIRSGLVIMVFAFLGIRGYKVASSAPDPFSRMVATGITTWLMSQALINIGAMLSILPLTGVPLPFISYGGSSLIILLSAVGILVNISKNQVKILKK